MPYVPGFDYDLFVSYASADNQQGGVEEFVCAVEKQISDNLVNCFSPQEKIRIYFDRQRLAGKTCVNWEEHLRAAASSSAILLPLLSPNYLSSPVCNQERDWFASQSHAQERYSISMAVWLDYANYPLPAELQKAQRHPAVGSCLGLMSSSGRLQSAREFALKLRDAFVQLRASVSAVFVGSAAGRGLSTRSRLRDELEKAGYRVVPDAGYEYRDPKEIQALLKSALLAIHFPGDGLDLDAFTAMEESFRTARKTLLIQPLGSTLDEEEAGVLEEMEAALSPGGRFQGAAHTRLKHKTDDQIWDIVKREVRAARFHRSKDEFAVGIACEVRDLGGAKAVASLMDQLGVRAQYPAFDTATSIMERLAALRATITQSKALLCYWAQADGKGLAKRLQQDARRQFKAKAWYLAPPMDVPGKEQLNPAREMILRQATAEVELATLEPFLRELGWEPPS